VKRSVMKSKREPPKQCGRGKLTKKGTAMVARTSNAQRIVLPGKGGTLREERGASLRKKNSPKGGGKPWERRKKDTDTLKAVSHRLRQLKKQ